jgi:plasmid stabilization system protein ParE
VKLVFSSAFEEDFAELVTRFARDASAAVAARFEQNTCKLIQSLMQHSEMGRRRTDLRPEGIRSFRVHGFDRYLLFYQVRGNDLVLLRLRYGGMNLQALFLSLS